MEPVAIQQRDQQLYVTSEPRQEWTSITRNTHLWPLNGMAENWTRAAKVASEHQTDHAIDGLDSCMNLWLKTGIGTKRYPAPKGEKKQAKKNLISKESIQTQSLVRIISCHGRQRIITPCITLVL